ncbi:uncharacterized protein ASPGLDRAFT_22966 [Aspergillus glaucus CBS 516.65]|uniref:Protein kinase domain-containing protein n=1 Tax=Aspergillus glaucus CBS 516.65 TaxID=1160497 RepID=A0A1L9VSK8_ASPGL|nr:hypothetical protein ASPGLDRAFT_22966 [Aspergillus glaucus CBS 516.65]OJJ86889.1 hypothetical protein ASPGLDRAFT_22966 [Aspergillus glaucus CBS 516.65]
MMLFAVFSRWACQIYPLACIRRTGGLQAAFKSTRASSHPPPAPEPVYQGNGGIEFYYHYEPGGHHPIGIGDVLQSRYRVVHKLGWGDSSIVWLCRDEQSSKYVAVKVAKGVSNAREADILDRLNDIDASTMGHLGRNMIPSVQDRFILHGVNGTHPCYVTSPARCSVVDTMERSSRPIFQLETGRSLAAQLALVVEYIHARGFVHGVDLCDDEEPLGSEAPKLATRPAWLGKDPEQYSPSEARLLITDFGETYSPGNDQIIAKEVDILGKPPQNWWEKWEARHQFFTETGERLSSKWQHPSWESHFEEDIQRSRREAWMPELDVEERDALTELFQCMLCWEPEKRLTIQGVLDSRLVLGTVLAENLTSYM